jgi:hypothetical protein
MQITSISRLADYFECKTLKALGRHFYEETECGVWTEYLTIDSSISSDSDHYGVKRDLPNIWAGHHVVGIKFGSIVEGSDAEFSADPIYFPCELSEIEDALQYLEEVTHEEFKLTH